MSQSGGEYIGAIDQGTTSTRFIVFDRQAKIVSTAQKEHRQIYPRPGWVEHDPIEIWKNTVAVIEEALQKCSLRPRDLACIGIANQRETTVVWNRKTGEPVCNAIVWQDTRVADIVARLCREGGKDRLKESTGLPFSTYFSGLKLAWILRHVDGVKGQLERGELCFGNIDAFLVWNLTGGSESGLHITDVTNASRTQLMNIQSLDWDQEILREFEIPPSLLPEIRSSSEHFAYIQHSSLSGVPLTGILGDQQSALVGQTCFQPGQVKNTYGTGCFLLMNTGTLRRSKNGLLTTVGYKFGKQAPTYALEGGFAIAGALVQWIRDNLGLIHKSEDIESLALSVPDNGEVYLVPAFSGLYAPYWREDARGAIVGLTRYANKGHIARAALEATAFQTMDIVQAMEADAGIPLSEVRSDGGMVANDLLMQFQSDILNRDVIRPVMRETTALGAAYAAALGVGYFSDLRDLVKNWQIDHIWHPKMDESQREHRCSQWKKAVKRTFDWID